MNFKLAYTTTEAAKYAVEKWHYSRCLPSCGLVKIGVWENEKYIGCIIFSNGACPQIAAPFGLTRFEICELTRIALTKHVNPVSKFLSIAIRMVKKLMPKLKMIVSYADPEQDHHGGIYQATNWIYIGTTKSATHFKNEGGFSIHSKTLCTGRKGLATKLLKEGKITKVFTYKHKYIYPLEKDLKDIWSKKAQPYPKPMRTSNNSNSSANHTEDGVQVHPSALLPEESYVE